MTPRVSVLLPVRDAEATVARAVGDILRQTVTELELLVVDDGSTDGTAAILDRLEDPRVTVVHTAPLGVVAASNLALSKARAPFVARMDADDECAPERLSRSLEALDRDPSLAGIGVPVEIFRDDRPVSPNLQAHAHWLNSLTTPEALYADRLVESPLCNPGITLRREAIDGWREGDFPEDWELFLRILEQGKLTCLTGPALVRWRDHDRRLTRTDARYARERHLDLKARFLSRVRPLTVWGAGETGLAIARRMGGADRFLEVDPRKIGMRIDGAMVLSHEAVGPPTGHLVAAVAAKGARAEIRAFLAARGWREGRDFTCVA